MILDEKQTWALRAAFRGGRRHDGRSVRLDVDALVACVSEVLTPIAVEHLLALYDCDDQSLLEVWERTEFHIQRRVRRVIEKAVADLEAQGIPVGDDPDSIDRALTAALGLHTVNEGQEQPA